MTITISSADSEKITNGGFETGTLAVWTVVTGTGTVTIETPAPIGTYYSYLDGDFDSTTYIYQSVDLTNVDNLTFKYKADADFFEGSSATDVYIGAIKVASKLHSIAWDDKSIDVSTYSGVHTVKFLVELADNSEGYAYMYLDGISAIRSYNVSKPTDQTNLGNNLIDHTPTITWTKGASAEADTITTYIYVGTTSTPTAIEGFTTEETYDLGTNITLTDGNTYYYRLRSYNGTSYSSYTTADEFRMNTPPSTPTIINPIDMSYTDSNETALNVSSTDAEGDSLVFYFYGDTIDGTTLINISTTGNYTWTTEFDYNIYYWKVRAYDSYEYSTNTSLQQFTLLAPPDLQTPTNASTHTYPFPPLLHDLTFTWQDTNAPAYKYQVATDDDFNLITEEDTITSNTTTLSLEADDYYWRVYAYETSTDTLSNASDIWRFTINETNGNGAVTAIDGVVYEITTGGSVEVDGALVNIWNTTWSDSMLVGQNGYYYFDGAKDGTYSVRATKTGYTDSSIELVTVLALNTTTRNILLQSTSGAGQQYVDHYVKFTVKSLFGALYGGVDVNVYLVDAVIPQYTATTGNDGSVAFELNENQQYRLTFIDTTQGINEERTLYPIENAYNVYVIANIFATGGNIISDDISITIETATAGANAYINVTYTDNKTETTALYFYLNQTNIHDSQNQTLIASSGEIHATGFYSFTVTDYTGEAYLIHVHATHDTYGDIKESYSVRFEGLLDSFGWDGIWVLIALGCITFTAFMFGAKNATQGSFVICVEAWLFIAMGMFGDYNTIWFKAGVAMATLISILANMEKHDSERS